MVTIPQYNVNVFNNGKKLEQQHITRFHNRFRYDEYSNLKENELSIKISKKAEKVNYQKIEKQFEDIINKYLDPSLKRKDTRSQDLPESYGIYEYFTKHQFMGNNDYEVIYRRNKLTNKEELILDLQEIPIVKNYYKESASLQKMSVSDDHNYLVFGVDLQSNENLIFFIKDIKNNKILKEELENVSNVKFNFDSKSILYVLRDEKHWTHSIYQHVIGTNQSQDILVYKEKDQQYYLDITVTKDKQYFLITCVTKTNSEILVIERNLPIIQPNKIKNLFNRNKNSRAFANHSLDHFYMLTDQDGAYDFKIVKLSDQNFKNGKTNNENNFNFTQFYQPPSGEIIEDIDIFKEHIVLYVNKEGNGHITIINLKDNSNIFQVQLEEEMIKISPGMNENFDTEIFRFHVDTPFIYNRIYEYNIQTRLLKMLEDFKMSGPNFNSKDYTITKTHSPTFDGESIPVTIIHKKNIQKNRKNKLLLHGYGHYGLPVEVNFNIAYLSALEDNWILAYAHIRGGNEKGWAWHKSAIQGNKIKSYKDFIACAEFLIAQGYTHPSLMCAFGSSAGGTLVGSVINMRPELFKAVVLHFPFLDILTSLLDENLPLSKSDYQEFGNPIEDSVIYDLIQSYSPYENIQNVEYPAIYIACGSEDYRTPLWNVIKYVKRFRVKSKDPQRVGEITDKNIVVNIIDSGHQGNSSVQSGIKEKCQYLGFLEYVVMKKNNDIKIKD